MNQNPIEDVLDELQFTEVQKEGFWKFLNYAKTLKSQLEEVVREIVSKS